MLLGFVLASMAGTGALSQALAQASLQPAKRPIIVLGRNHPGRITGQDENGLVVDLRNGTAQAVQFGEIWRIRRAFASDEPAGTAVIDFANNRLFVATPLANLVSDAGKKIPLVRFTAPNGEAIYMAASKVTGISDSLPGVHNPQSKTVIGTRDGTQQIIETADAARQIVAAAHAGPR